MRVRYFFRLYYTFIFNVFRKYIKLISYARQSVIWGVNKEQNSYAFISRVAFSLRQTNINQVIT